MSAFGEQVELLTRQEALQKELETVGEDMDAMTRILDELDSLNTKVGADGSGAMPLPSAVIGALSRVHPVRVAVVRIRLPKTAQCSNPLCCICCIFRMASGSVFAAAMLAFSYGQAH